MADNQVADGPVSEDRVIELESVWKIFGERAPEAMQAVEGVRLIVKEAPRAISERDDRLLAKQLEDLANQNQEQDGDEDEEEEGMGSLPDV